MVDRNIDKTAWRLGTSLPTPSGRGAGGEGGSHSVLLIVHPSSLIPLPFRVRVSLVFHPWPLPALQIARQLLCVVNSSSYLRHPRSVIRCPKSLFCADLRCCDLLSGRTAAAPEHGTAIHRLPKRQPGRSPTRCYTQVQRSPCPEGATDSSPAIHRWAKGSVQSCQFHRDE
jgi:hypothetical protein